MDAVTGSESGRSVARRLWARFVAVLAVALSTVVVAGLVAAPAYAADSGSAGSNSAGSGGQAGSMRGTVVGPVTCSDAGAPFVDVRRDGVHCDSITWLAQTGLTTPAGKRYHPARAVSRGAMTAFLFRLTHAGEPDPVCQNLPPVYEPAPDESAPADPDNPADSAASWWFSDVPAGGTFCGTIRWAKQAGVTQGRGDGTFGPGNPVTRAQMAAFLRRVVLRAQAAADNDTTDQQQDQHQDQQQDQHQDQQSQPAELPPIPPAPACTVAPFSDVPVDGALCPAVRWLHHTGITQGRGDGTFGPGNPVTRAQMATFLRRIVAGTDIAPGWGTQPLGALGGAWVELTRTPAPQPAEAQQPDPAQQPASVQQSDQARLPTSVTVVRTGPDGRFTAAGLAPGKYQVCVDAGGVIPARSGGYADGCAGQVVWPWDDPRAPAAAPTITVAAGATTTGVTVTLGRADDALQGRRAPAVTVAHPDDHYVLFGTYTYDGKQVLSAFSPCRAIHYVVQADLAFDGAAAMVHEAVQRVSRATGLRFAYDGVTATPVNQYRFDTGHGFAPVLIAWSNEQESPKLAGGVLGFAQSFHVRAVTTDADGNMGTAFPFVTGQIRLDAPDLAAMAGAGEPGPGAAEVTATIMHELGHLVGLDHVGDRSQLMYPYMRPSVVNYGAADLTGLAQAGRGVCTTGYLKGSWAYPGPVY